MGIIYRAYRRARSFLRPLRLERERRNKRRALVREAASRPSHFKRHLSSEEARRLAETCSAALRADFSVEDVQKFAETFRSIEAKICGRIAGDVDDHFLNYSMIASNAHLSSDRPVAHAEIGVLFGGSLILMLHALKEARSDHWAIGVDPLEGYYGKEFDSILHIPINLKTVVKNIRRCGFSRKKVRLVRGFSQTPEAIRTTGQFDLATLWIDGDHSYEGLKNDWENYAPMVMAGGYVLIDNYHDRSWPEVTEFIDKELLPAPEGWEKPLIMGRSVLFRKRGPKDSAS